MADLFVTLEQIKAARALLQWTQKDLAAHAGLNDAQVHSFESGRTRSLEVMEAVCRALINGGIQFTEDGGVRPNRERILTFSGRDGFSDFRKDILFEAEKASLNACVSNVDEREFDKWGAGTVNENYFRRMKELKPSSFRILVKERDFYLSAADYATYKWLPEGIFGEIAFFIYANKVAIISFEENNFQAFVISQPKITNFYRKEFERLWSLGNEKAQT